MQKNVSKKKAHLVFDHQGAFIFEGTARQVAEHLNLNYKSVLNAAYQNKAIHHYVVMLRENALKMSLKQLLNHCRSCDVRYIDIDENEKPVYKRYKSSCKNHIFVACDAESLFDEDDLLTAEENYQKEYDIKQHS